MAALSKNATGLRTIPLITLQGPGVIPPEEVMPGQVGAATLWTTELGTRCWVRERFTTPGDQATRWLQVTPENLDRNVKTAHVVHSHGNTSEMSQIFDGLDTVPPRHDTGQTKIVNACLDEGWAVDSLQLGQDPTNVFDSGKWGNQVVRNGAIAILNQLASEFTLPDNGWLFTSYSAGGCHTMNILMEMLLQGLPVAGAAINDPAVWLRNMRRASDWHQEPPPYGSSSNIAQNVARAYACPPGEPPNLTNSAYWPGTANWTAAVDTPNGGHDPVWVAQNFPARIPNKPLLIMASRQDTTVQMESNGELLYNALIAAGRTNVELHTWPSGDHGASNHFDVDTFMTFLQAALV